MLSRLLQSYTISNVNQAENIRLSKEDRHTALLYASKICYHIAGDAQVITTPAPLHS